MAEDDGIVINPSKRIIWHGGIRGPGTSWENAVLQTLGGADEGSICLHFGFLQGNTLCSSALHPCINDSGTMSLRNASSSLLLLLCMCIIYSFLLED